MSLGWSFRRFWAATGLSNFADGMFGVTIALTALTLTRSPVQVAALSAAAGLPWLIFGLFAGAIADRTDRRRLMIGVQGLRAVLLLLLTLAVVTDHVGLWLLYVIAVAMGVAETLYDTTAQTVLPKLVESDRLERANSRLTGAELVGNFFVGPPVGGIVSGLATAASFASGSALYLLAGIGLLTVRGSFQVERVGSPTSLRQDIGEGLRYLRGQTLLSRLALLTGARLLTFTAVVGILPVYAVAPGPMGLNAFGYGLFCAATAIGAVLSSLTGERVVARLGSARCLHLTLPAFAVTELAPLAENPFVVGALWMVGTYFVIIWNVVTLSARQRLVPEHLLGRVNSVFRILTWGVGPVGALLGGGLAETVGFRWTFVVLGVATALLAFGTLRITDESLTSGQIGQGVRV